MAEVEVSIAGLGKPEQFCANVVWEGVKFKFDRVIVRLVGEHVVKEG